MKSVSRVVSCGYDSPADPPELETRVAIVKKKAESSALTFLMKLLLLPSIYVRMSANLRRCNVVANASFTGCEITLEQVKGAMTLSSPTDKLALKTSSAPLRTTTTLGQICTAKAIAFIGTSSTGCNGTVKGADQSYFRRLGRIWRSRPYHCCMPVVELMSCVTNRQSEKTTAIDAYAHGLISAATRPLLESLLLTEKIASMKISIIENVVAASAGGSRRASSDAACVVYRAYALRHSRYDGY